MLDSSSCPHFHCGPDWIDCLGGRTLPLPALPPQAGLLQGRDSEVIHFPFPEVHAQASSVGDVPRIPKSTAGGGQGHDLLKLPARQELRPLGAPWSLNDSGGKGSGLCDSETQPTQSLRLRGAVRDSGD